MSNVLARSRLFVALACLSIVLAFQTRAYGQEPTLEVFYSKLAPQAEFRYSWKGKEATCTAGVFQWEVPQTEFGTNGLDRNFTGYCAEIRVPITANKLHRFRTNSIYAVENYEGLTAHEQGPLAAQRRALYVKELFGRYYRDPVLRTTNEDEAIALQVALWEVIQETEPAEGNAKLDLFAGDFQASYARDQAPAFVRTAQSYLDSLTGDDAVFYKNADLRGRELIRLKGIENAEKVIAQSQFALRYASGGALNSSNLTHALTTGSNLGPVGPAASGPRNRFASYLPGNNGQPPNGGGNPNPPPGTVPPPSVEPPPVGPPPVIPPTTTPPDSGPPNVPPDTPPVDVPPSDNPPDTPTPTPAPAGLLLGVIAAGSVAAWRFRTRLIASKTSAKKR